MHRGSHRRPGVRAAVATFAAAAFVAFTPGARASGPMALPPESAKWSEYRSGNFVVFSEERESKTRVIVHELELLRAVLQQLTPDLRSGAMKVSSPVPTFVYIFANEKNYVRYSGSPGTGGYFAPRNEANFVVINGGGDTEPALQTVRHEYLHYFLDNNFPAVPVWLNEGLAEFYSTMAERKDTVDLGRPLDHHLQRIAARNVMPLAQLFAVRHDSPEYNEQLKRGPLYATSWLVVHYLLAGGNPERHAQLGQYLAALRQGASPEAALQVFKGGVAALQEELQPYMRRILKSYGYWRLRFVELTVDDAATARPLPRAELLARLALMLATPEQAADAERHLAAAAAIAPESGLVPFAEGVLRMYQRRYEEAGALFRRAADADPSSALAQYFAGAHALGAWPGSSGPKEGALAETLAVARRYLERSAGLDPKHGETQALLGLSYLMDREAPDVSPGIAHLEAAHRLLPSRWDVTVNLAHLYARAGQADKARAAYELTLRQGTDEGVKTAARQGLSAISSGSVTSGVSSVARPAQRGWTRSAPNDPMADVFVKAMGLLSEDKAGARLLLQRVVEEGYDQAVVKAAAEVLADMDRRRAIDEYNRAVTLAKNGKYAEAIEIVRELSRSAPQPEIREKAEELVLKWSARL